MLLSEHSKLTTEQGNSRGQRVRQQGSSGAREHVKRDAELEDKEETEEKGSNNPVPAWKVLKLDTEAYPKIGDTSYGWRVRLPHSPGGQTCLRCRCVPGTTLPRTSRYRIGSKREKIQGKGSTAAWTARPRSSTAGLEATTTPRPYKKKKIL